MKLSRTPFDVTHELIAAYDEYIALLAAAEGSLLGLAMAHGYKTSGENVATGKTLREKIAALKAELPAY